MMSRKNYLAAVALIVARYTERPDLCERTGGPGGHGSELDRVAALFADFFDADNPAFDRGRFQCAIWDKLFVDGVHVARLSESAHYIGPDGKGSATGTNIRRKEGAL